MINESKKNIFLDSLKYIMSQYVALAFGIVISITMKRFLGPELIGAWNVVLVIMVYCSYASLGAPEVAYRDIPFYKGSSQLKKAEDLTNSVFTIVLVTSLFLSITLALYVLYAKAQLSKAVWVCLVYAAFVMVFQKVYDYLTVVLRAHKEFTVISQITVISAFANLIFVFLLIKPLKLYGLLLGSFLSIVIGLAYVWLKAPYRLKLRFSFADLKKIISIGIPLFILGLCTQSTLNIDKIILTKYLGVTALGNYSISLMVGGYLSGIPNMFGIALYPRLQEKYGQEKTAEGIKHYLLEPILIVSILMGALIGYSVLAAPALIEWLLPSFRGGIPAMKIYVWSSFFMAIGQFPCAYLVAMNKQWKVIPFLLSGIVLIAGLCYWFIKLGWGLEGAAWATLIGGFLYNSALIIYAKSFFASRTQIFKFLGMVLLSFLYYFCLSNVMACVVNCHRGGLYLMLSLAVYTILIVPLLCWLNKKTHFLQVAIQSLSGQFRRNNLINV